MALERTAREKADEMSSVKVFPRYKLKDIPASLRLLADLLESGEDPQAVRCVVILEHRESPHEISYRAFGEDPFTRAHAAGLCVAASLAVLGHSSSSEG